MARGILNESPSSADHRIIVYILDTFFKKKNVVHDPQEFDHVSRVFARAGGSWERLFKGSASDVNLLRKIVKIALAGGHLTEVPRFR